MAAYENDPEAKLEPELNITPVSSDPVKPSGFFARLRYYEEMLDRKLGIESNSLDRVHPEDRKSPSPVVMAFMWASATMNISCFSTGFLGNEFGLSLGETIPIVIFSTFLGSAVTVSGLLLRAIICCKMNIDLIAQIRVGAPLWVPELACAKSPYQDTHSASTLPR